MGPAPIIVKRRGGRCHRASSSSPAPTVPRRGPPMDSMGLTASRRNRGSKCSTIRRSRSSTRVDFSGTRGRCRTRSRSRTRSSVGSPPTVRPPTTTVTRGRSTDRPRPAAPAIQGSMVTPSACVGSSTRSRFRFRPWPVSCTGGRGSSTARRMSMGRASITTPSISGSCPEPGMRVDPSSCIPTTTSPSTVPSCTTRATTRRA